MVHAQFVISLLHRLQLLLCRNELCVEEVHLLGRDNVFGHNIGFPGSRCLSSDVVKSIFVVHLEIGVLELPSLRKLVVHCADQRSGSLTPRPYGEVPPSSLLCRTLWKSYLFSWRTKLAKLLCLKCFGRMCFVNFSFCNRVSADAPSTVVAPVLSLPPTPRSCLLHCPSVRRSRLVGSPTSYYIIVSRRTGCSRVEMLTCKACAPVAVSSWTVAAHCRALLTKSLELFA